MYLVGCDFHTRMQQIASMNLQTGEIQRLHLEHKGDAVREFYARLPKPVRVGIESTGYSLWFEQMLQELGCELVVGDAAEIRARKVKKQKNDKLDAEHILKLLARGEFPVLYWPSLQVRDHRAVLWHRQRLVKIRTRMKNSVHAIALSYRKHWAVGLFTRRGLKQLQELDLPPHMARQRDQSLALVHQLDEWIQELDEAIEQVIEQYPEAKLLMSHPGVGAQTALAFVLVIGNVERFTNGKQVASYVGLAPAEDSSADHQRFGRITKQGNKLLRGLLGQAANIASKYDPQLRNRYYRILHKKGPRKAKVAVARQLAVRLYIMLRDRIDYPEFCKRGLKVEGTLPAGRA